MREMGRIAGRKSARVNKGMHAEWGRLGAEKRRQMKLEKLRSEKKISTSGN